MSEPSPTSIEGAAAGAETTTGIVFDEGADVGASHVAVGVDAVVAGSTLLPKGSDGASMTGADVSVATGASGTSDGGSGTGSTGWVTVGA